MVVGQRGWHPGLMGPLASQLMERYARPTVAIAWNERIGIGSGRSTSVFNLLEALRACEGTLLRYGGHPQACGLTLKRANLETFREQINRHAHTALGRQRLVPRLTIDLELALRDVTTSFASALERFKPFGPGNPRPLILLRGLALERNPAGGTWVTDGRTRIRTRGGLAGLLSSERYDVVASPACVEGRVVLSICDARVAATALL
jgi:single-stranded-DNA-specific exonuclease